MPTQVVARTPKEVWELWIAALRSRTYTQGYYKLRRIFSEARTVQYCCLGVICDLARMDGGPKWKHNDEFMEHTKRLPHQMSSWLGLHDEDLQALIVMNDDNLSTFDQIADYLETKLMPRALKRLKSNSN